MDFYVAIWGLRMDGPGWTRGGQAGKPSTRRARRSSFAEVYATLATIRASQSESWVATIELAPSGPRLAMVERSDYADR